VNVSVALWTERLDRFWEEDRGFDLKKEVKHRKFFCDIAAILDDFIESSIIHVCKCL